MGKLALAVSNLDSLFHAWRDVRSQVQRSSWPRLRAELTEFDAQPLRALRRIQKQLRHGRYKFSAKWGYAKRKSGGSRRGITVHCVSDRIVQRAVLDVISTSAPAIRNLLGEIPATLDRPTSFAGIMGRGVPEAVALAAKLIRSGARAFALSDMKDFFPRVPRGEVVEFVNSQVDDHEFVDLFRAALETEIENSEVIAQWLGLFPITDIGVAQGSLLSVLVGNLALRHFDARVNAGGLTTIRYLDDFAIFGPDLDAVDAGFLAAKAELARLGMTCYDPGDGSQKAFRGQTAHGFNFLGCRIHPDGVSPTRSARRKLLREIAVIISEAKQQIRELQRAASRRGSEGAYVQTMARIDRKVRGWGDAYRFVTNRVAFSQIDREIDRKLDSFERWFRRQCSLADARTKRRISGVALLGDTPPRTLISSFKTLP
jgi:RNA-directed DNA polymerase